MVKKIILCEAFGRYWTKKDLKLLKLALDKGQSNIADLTQREYDILEYVIKNIKGMINGDVLYKD